MVTRNGFLGQVQLMPPREQYQSYPNAPMRPTFPTPGGTCPPGKMPFNFADRTVCVDSGFYPFGAAGSEPGAVRPPGTPQIEPPIEYPPPTIEDIGPELPSVESRDDFYPYRTGMAPARCDTSRGQFIDPRTGQCRGSISSIPTGVFGGFGPNVAAGNVAFAPQMTTAAAFTMGGRAMLGRVRLVRRPY